MLHPLGSFVSAGMAIVFTLCVLALGPVTAPASATTPAGLDPVPIDFAQGIVDGSAFHRSRFPWLAFGDAVYFTAFDPLHGRELWRSDGTEAGTYMVRDLCPGPCDGLDRFEDSARIFDGRLYFAGNDGAFGTELWTSDGTAEGTRLVADFCFGPCDGLGNPRLGPAGPIEPFGDQLFVAATDGVHGREPWLIDRDGSFEQIVDLCPGPCSSSPFETVATGAGLFFLATDFPGRHTRKLFVTDGSAEGTRHLAEETPNHLFAFGDRLVFLQHQPETGLEPWVSDGTVKGTHLFFDLCPGRCSGPNHGFLFATDDTLFLSATLDPEEAAPDLVRTDGTVEGTVVVAPGHFPEPPVLRFGDELLFTSRDEGCPGLWTTAGTPETTRPLVCQRPIELASAGDRLFIAFNRSLHAHFGLPEAPVGIQDLPRLFAGDLAQLTVLGDQILFKGHTEAEGFEPWRSDGTLDGTQQLRNIHRAELSGAPRHLAEIGGAMLFEVFEGPEREVQVWRVDGTRGGASRLEVGPPQISPFLRHGDTLLYSSEHVRHNDGTDGLWQTDGTPEGTVQLSGSAVALGAGGGFARRFLFQAYSASLSSGGGSELWVTNGKSDGTRFVADIYPGFIPIAPPMANSSDPDGFTPLGQRVVFAATGEDGRELWSSNTTAAGTTLVRDICRDCSSDPRELTRLGKQIFFTAVHPRLGRELWRTDGTEDGTRPVRDLRRGELGAAPHDLVVLRGRIVFAARAATGGEDDAGESLWRTEGTLRSTRRLAALPPGAFVTESLRIGRIAYFAVVDPSTGSSLWISDGTRRGTRHVLALRAAPGGAPRSFAEVDGRLLFATDDGVHGEELWMSDGTAEGTIRLTDLAPGILPSAPREITSAGARVYFSANDGAHGRELWSFELESLP